MPPPSSQAADWSSGSPDIRFGPGRGRTSHHEAPRHGDAGRSVSACQPSPGATMKTSDGPRMLLARTWPVRPQDDRTPNLCVAPSLPAMHRRTTRFSPSGTQIQCEAARGPTATRPRRRQERESQARPTPAGRARGRRQQPPVSSIPHRHPDAHARGHPRGVFRYAGPGGQTALTRTIPPPS
jgi:hypothetical protein